MNACHRYNQPGRCMRCCAWCASYYPSYNRFTHCTRTDVTCYTLEPWLPVCASRGRFVGGVWRSA